MALKNLFGKKTDASSACGCGDKRTSTACGCGDKKSGSACGCGDKN